MFLALCVSFDDKLNAIPLRYPGSLRYLLVQVVQVMMLSEEWFK